MSAVAYHNILPSRQSLFTSADDKPPTLKHPHSNALKHTCCPPFCLPTLLKAGPMNTCFCQQASGSCKVALTFTLVFSAKQAKRLKWNTLSQKAPLGKEHISSCLLPMPFLAQVSFVTQDFFSAKMGIIEDLTRPVKAHNSPLFPFQTWILSPSSHIFPDPQVPSAA